MKNKFFTKENLRVFFTIGTYEKDFVTKKMTYARIAQVNILYNLLQIKAHLVERIDNKTGEKAFFIEMPGIFYKNRKTGLGGINFLNFWSSTEINKEFQEFILNELKEKFPSCFDKISMKKKSKKSKRKGL